MSAFTLCSAASDGRSDDSDDLEQFMSASDLHGYADNPFSASIDEAILANVIVCQTVFRNCEYFRPRFTIFTPTYKTGERIYRTYESLNNQTFDNWEW